MGLKYVCDNEKKIPYSFKAFYLYKCLNHLGFGISCLKSVFTSYTCVLLYALNGHSSIQIVAKGQAQLYHLKAKTKSPKY